MGIFVGKWQVVSRAGGPGETKQADLSVTQACL